MKIYKVVFNQYTNCMKSTVSDGNDEFGENKYIRVGNEAFLITEDQIEEMKQFGNGIKSLEFMGNLWNGEII